MHGTKKHGTRPGHDACQITIDDPATAETLVDTTSYDEPFEEQLVSAYETGREDGILYYKNKLIGKTKQILRANMFRDFSEQKSIEIDQNKEQDSEHSARLKSGQNYTQTSVDSKLREAFLIKLFRKNKMGSSV